MSADRIFELTTRWLVPAVTLTGCILLTVMVRWIVSRDSGSERMKEIATYIRKGAWAFLFNEYRVLVPLLAALTLALCLCVSLRAGLCFLAGGGCSALAGALGMTIATMANVRTANAARHGAGEALGIAFAGGAVMGISVSMLGLLGVTLAYAFTREVQAVSCFALGASLVALLARVGGGIYTKASDVAADIVGKTELGIGEDDPRNAAVIADNVGDNVGDVAGMGADLYESYVGVLFSTIALGGISHGLSGICYPILLMGAGLLASLLSVGLVVGSSRWRPQADPGRTLSAGLCVAAVLAGVGALGIARFLFGSFQMAFAVLVGAGAGVAIGRITEHFTSGGRVQAIARASLSGPATNIISGLAMGLASTAPTALVIGVAILTSFELGGLYGIGLAGVGMLCTLGMTLSVDAYGPIADNAGGIAQMAGLPASVREVTDRLDSVGNTTAAIGKGFAIGSATLTALALFASFGERVGLTSVDLLKPGVYVGILVGGVLPFLFSSLTIRAVGTSAHEMVAEIRRQFREIAGLAEGTVPPDYEACIRIASQGALKSMVLPALLCIVFPFATYGLLGVEALAGLLAGTTITGMLLAVFLANAGGAWDNAKKFIEEGNLGERGSPAHRAAVVGDTVGDPLKDTAGPSINILIKLVSIVSIVVIPVVSKW